MTLAVTPEPGGGKPKENRYDRPAPGTMAADTGETLGLSPARFTLTFGFGAGLLGQAGKHRQDRGGQRRLPECRGQEQVEDVREGGHAVTSAGGPEAPPVRCRSRMAIPPRARPRPSLISTRRWRIATRLNSEELPSIIAT